MSRPAEHPEERAPEPADADLQDLGRLLRESRQARGEDLYDVAGYLRIKPSYLLALEAGDLSLTPGRVYALGFLRSYGEHLGYDGEELVRYAKTALSGTASRPELNYRMPLAESRRPSGIFIALSILIVGLVYGGWRLLSGDQPTLDRVSAVPGTVGRVASEVLAFGSDRALDLPASLPGGSPPVATGATAATPGPDEQAALAAEGPFPPILPEAGLTGTPTPQPTALSAAGTGDGTAPAASPEEAIAAPAAMAAAPALALAAPAVEPAGAVAAPPADRDEAAPSSGAAFGRAVAGVPPEASPGATAAADGRGARALLASLAGGDARMAGPAPAGSAVVPDAAGRIALVASEESWVQVRSEDRQFIRTRTLQPGDRLELPDRDDLALWTGNAGGLTVVLDGRSLGALGTSGHVVRDVPLTPEALRARLSASR